MRINYLNDIKTFLFNNLNTKQTIFKNTFWLGAAIVVTKFLNFILFIYIARILGATEYGKFTFALAFVGLFIIFSDLGLSQIITREFAREKEKEREFSAILSLKILLSLATLILILVGSFFIIHDPLIQRIILILAIYLLIESFYGMIFSFLQARQKMEYQFFASIFEALLVAGAGLFILFYFPSVQNLSYSYLFAALITLIFVLFFFHFRIQRLFLSLNKSIWQRFLSMSWPLALAAMAGTICNQTDSVMLGYFGMIKETGWYNAAYRITITTIVPVSLISTSFYPVLNKFFKESKEKLQRTWNHQLEIMILLFLPLVVGGMVLGPKIIYSFYPLDFAPATLAFQILILTAGTMSLCRPFYDVMIVLNQQTKTFWITIAGAVTNVILNLILIPKYSLYGAAVATVITHFLLLFILMFFVKKFTFICLPVLRIFLTFLISAIASVSMYFIIKQPLIYNINIFLLVLIGAAIYFTVFLVIRKYIFRYFKRIYV